MKTEVNISVGAQNVGKTVKGFGRGVQEGAIISAGEVLVVFE
jgi:urea carboxylase